MTKKREPRMYEVPPHVPPQPTEMRFLSEKEQIDELCDMVTRLRVDVLNLTGERDKWKRKVEEARAAALALLDFIDENDEECEHYYDPRTLVERLPDELREQVESFRAKEPE